MTIKNIFSVYEPVSRDFLELAAKEKGFGFGLGLLPNYKMPKEDYLSMSQKYPIFAVADGVTMELENYMIFPEISGAGEAARIFCEEIIKQTEIIYDNFNENDLNGVFLEANTAVGRYNESSGRSKESINYWDFDLFAATGAFAAAKGDIIYWASICDSFIGKIGKGSNLLDFCSPDCGYEMRKYLPSGWKTKSIDERKKILRKDYRNGIDDKGNLVGYGVATGENTACRYLNFGSFSVKEGETLILYTDGFENYFKDESFVFLVRSAGGNFYEELKKFSETIIPKEPGLFGHERSLVVVQF